MNNKIIIKKIVKITPVKEVFELSMLKFSDGTESIAIYEHFKKNDFAVVISSSLIFNSWFFKIFSKYLNYDSFSLPIRLFNRLKPSHDGHGKIEHFEKENFDITDILIKDLFDESNAN